jgi:hypothetical protein
MSARPDSVRDSAVGAPAWGRRRRRVSVSRFTGQAALGRPPTVGDNARLAAHIAGPLMVAVCVIGLAVRLGFAAQARRWLAFPFTGVPASPSEAADVFLHNLRDLVAVGALLLIAQLPSWEDRLEQPGAIHRALQRGGEALLSAAVAVNVLVVGLGLGAYGTRMVGAVVPHGPLELAAYSLALALYLQGRRRRLPTRHMLTIGGLSLSALALAALLEVYVNV